MIEDPREEEYAAERAWINAYLDEHPAPDGLEFHIELPEDEKGKQIATSPFFPGFKVVLFNADACDLYYALCGWVRDTYHPVLQTTQQ